MSEAPKKKGLRLPWLTDDESAEAEGAAEHANGQESTVALEASDATPAAAPAPAEVAPSEAAAPLLQSMVDAMLRIAEKARDEAMASMRASVEEREGDLQSAADLRAAELRDRADADVARIGEWEQGEVQRVRDEAAAKVADRQRKLEGELQANTAKGEGAASALHARVESFEREMAAFFERLADVHDPAAFAAVVKRMPSPPVFGETAPAAAAQPMDEPAVTPAWPTEPEMRSAAAEPPQVPGWGAPAPRAAEEHAEAASEPEPEGPDAAEATAPVDAAPAPVEAAPAAPAVQAPPVDPRAGATGDEMSTEILVSGLGSFGAITSFKQSLERADGIHRVTLGLGKSGEFVFTAIHASGFDPATAIRTFESSAQFQTDEGRLKVTVGSAA